MLNQKNRFHRRKHVVSTLSKGKTVRSSSMTLKYTLHPKNTEPRVAVVVSRKVAKGAVVRNKIRRRVYDAIRPELENISEHFAGVILIRDISIATMPFENLQTEIKQLLAKIEKD